MQRRIGLIALGVLLGAVLELALLVFVARELGLLVTVLLVLATSVLGGWLLRREGVRAWRALRAAASAGRPVGAQVSDGVVGLVSALLLVVPGFLTDLLGLALRVPVARRIAGAGVRGLAERRFSPALAGDLFGPRRVRVRRSAPVPDDDAPIEGEIVDP
ncbi:MAG: exlusion protein FxsA [Actinobacteria bacterium 13_1_20CM_3_71_11]|nr:MAG: exlusion protein FxsA [Actinobacteria bacterium 13_1_20CM_3_71_11]